MPEKTLRLNFEGPGRWVESQLRLPDGSWFARDNFGGKIIVPYHGEGQGHRNAPDPEGLAIMRRIVYAVNTFNGEVPDVNDMPIVANDRFAE